MSTRRMTRERRVEWRWPSGDTWRPVPPPPDAPLVHLGYVTRIVERMVTEWTEVTE